jgi:hypothetical protein
MPKAEELAGLDGFISVVSALTAEAVSGRRSDAWLIRRMGEDFAYIRLQDVLNFPRFLRQMAGEPPVRFGITGFWPAVVDDKNPARHYTALLTVGYWLPMPAAILVLWLWEIAGFVRYRGHWSWPDLANGYIGIRHGRWVRRYGASILPGLIARHLSA